VSPAGEDKRSDTGARAFKALERSGWDERAETYDLLTGRITARLVEPLLDAAGVAAGARLLDVGTGPGYAAGRAARRGAVVTGVDIADELVALAGRRHPEIRFVRGDAEDLPVGDGSFDALVSNFAINHLPHPERAAREFSRVLVPGGGLALSAWDLPERNRFIGVLVDALRACGVHGLAPPGPDPYRFADDDEVRALLCDAGFETVEVLSLSLTHSVSDADELWRGLLGGSVRTAGLVMQQSPHTRRKIREALVQLAEEYRVGAELVIPVSAKIAHGRQP
jgi:SAM-dependent methyltransferase